jgi:hypothetical protein
VEGKGWSGGGGGKCEGGGQVHMKWRAAGHLLAGWQVGKGPVAKVVRRPRVRVRLVGEVHGVLRVERAGHAQQTNAARASKRLRKRRGRRNAIT